MPNHAPWPPRERIEHHPASRPDQELGEPNPIVEEQRARAAKEGAGADPLAALQQIRAN